MNISKQKEINRQEGPYYQKLQQSGALSSINKILQGPKTIEIAGYTILAMPLEAMALTPEQRKKFTQSKEKGGAGGFVVDCSKMKKAEQMKFAKDNPDAPIDWQESFETLESEIDGTLYKGFDLFKKVYEAFPDIHSMTQEQATEAGLYPIIHFRNFAARKWMAEMLGGHLATLDNGFNGELADIYKAAPGKTILQKLAAMGQAPLGWRLADVAKVYSLGHWALLGSGSLNGDGTVRALHAHRDKAFADLERLWQGFAVSSVVVMNK